MSLVFYFAPYSTATVTNAVLAELEHGLPNPLAQRVELSLQSGDTRTPKYLSTVDPNGRVPAIVHNGVPIWESAAITMYLGETFGVGDKALYPPLGPTRGEAMKWIVWTNLTLAVPGKQLGIALRAGSGGESEGEAAEKARKELAEGLQVLDGALKGKEFVLGDQYTLADTHLWSFVSWLTMMRVELEQYPDVSGWMKRVGGRPALQGLR
ncbi:MAG: hypothetical protein LQ351_001476 [Letrouitia transgressa]|nr:MAG: hypothetical protein LQ351_001476 [Letrouitia transgressa]